MLSSMKTSKPFVVSSSISKLQIRCCVCKSIINSERLRIGVREYKTTSWSHYECFWTNSYYRNHLRGVDNITLSELVDGFHSISQSDRTKLLTDASSSGVEPRKSRSKAPYEGSEADGDYELSENTFDLTNLVCTAVIKIQTNLFVSIRNYFIPRGTSVAKPTKSGITLNQDQWTKLQGHADDIAEAIKTTQKVLNEKEKETKSKKDKNDSKSSNDFPEWILFSLSWKRRVGVFACGDGVVIDIREFSEEKTFSESTRGIRLIPDQWKQLNDNFDNINLALNKL